MSHAKIISYVDSVTNKMAVSDDIKTVLEVVEAEHNSMLVCLRRLERRIGEVATQTDVNCATLIERLERLERQTGTGWAHSATTGGADK